MPAAPAPKLLDDWRDAVLYFVVLDRFADGDAASNAHVDVTKKGHFHGGDAKGLTARLDEVASLGVNALWITPIVRNTPGFVTGAGFPDWAYHGYWADDFLSLDPRFGNENDFIALVAACHARGIRVLLDVVYNHAGYESKYTKDPKTKGRRSGRAISSRTSSPRTTFPAVSSSSAETWSSSGSPQSSR